ncbi:MAG: hypothetical protein AAGF83_17070 [Cyanobacteria bacterium P01_G01_bin.67]
MTQIKPKTNHKPCYQCEGKGYTEIRDCAGQIQRTETCSYCEGRGSIAKSKVK